MSDSIFKDPEGMAARLGLPAIVPYSFIGAAGEAYLAEVESVLARLAGEPNIRGRSSRPSGGGKYVAYRFEVFHERIEEVEAVYRAVGELEGTRMVL